MIPFVINGEGYNSLESNLVCPAFTVPRSDGSLTPALRLSRKVVHAAMTLPSSEDPAKVCTVDVNYELCFLQFNRDPNAEIAVKLVDGTAYAVLDRERLSLWLIF